MDYAAKMYAAIGPQYSFFDDTGRGSFAPTGTATVQECLENLVTKVGLYGLTERFDEFTVLMGYLLGRPRILGYPARQRDESHPKPERPALKNFAHRAGARGDNKPAQG